MDVCSIGFRSQLIFGDEDATFPPSKVSYFHMWDLAADFKKQYRDYPQLEKWLSG